MQADLLATLAPASPSCRPSSIAFWNSPLWNSAQARSTSGSPGSGSASPACSRTQFFLTLAASKTYSPAYTYKGYDIYDRTHNYSEDPTTEFYKALRPIDFDIGIFGNDSRYKFSKERFSIKTTLRNREDLSNFLAFLYERSGRLKPCWVPTYGNDLQIATSSLAGQSTIVIENIGYSIFINSDSAKRDLMFIKPDGTVSFARIVAAADNGDGTETISLDSPLSINVDSTTYKMICFLKFARLDSDVAEIQWVTNEWGYSNLLFLELNESPT